MKFFYILLLLFVSIVNAQVPYAVNWTTNQAIWTPYYGGIWRPACSNTFLSPTNIASLTNPSLIISVGGLRLSNGYFGTATDLLVSRTNGINPNSSPSNPSSDITSLPVIDASGHYNGGAAYLANGNFIVFGGVNNGYNSNAVIWTHDLSTEYQEVTYFGFIDYPWYQYQSVAPWSPRNGFGYTVIPNTNIVVLTGGNGGMNTNTNDVWINTDGAPGSDDFTPPVWILQNRAGPLPPDSEGVVLSAMYNPSVLNNNLGTLILSGGYYMLPYIYQNGIRGMSNDVYISNDIGLTWTALLYRSFPERMYHSMIVDTDNIIYITGGQNTNSGNQILRDLWISKDTGISWTSLPVIHPLTSVWGNCIGMYYTYTPDNLSIASKSLYSWGGRNLNTGEYYGVYIGALSLPNVITTPFTNPLGNNNGLLYWGNFTILPITNGTITSGRRLLYYNNNTNINSSGSSTSTPTPIQIPMPPSTSTPPIPPTPPIPTKIGYNLLNGVLIDPNHIDLTVPLITQGSISVINKTLFGGNNETLTIDFWINPSNFSVGCDTLLNSIWLIWLQNNTDIISVSLQADGTLSFSIVNGFSGFYSSTSASNAIVLNKWQHIIIQSIPLPRTSSLALHTIQLNNTIIASNIYGRYPARRTRNIGWFGNGPYPTISAFSGHMTGLMITSK